MAGHRDDVSPEPVDPEEISHTGGRSAAINSE